MPCSYPQPDDIGIPIPRHLIEERFRRGFRHALEGGQITDVQQLRRSFREGFRAGKLYLRHARRVRGVVDFPMRGRVRCKIAH